MPQKKGVYSPVRRGDKLYRYHSWYENKRSAQSEARRLRKAGYLAMVRTIKRSYGTTYAVYSYK